MIHSLQPDPADGVDAGTRHVPPARPPALRLAEATAFGGLLLYAVFAPHSIAGAWIALSVSILGWLARALIMRRANHQPALSRQGFVRRTLLELPLWLFYAWSVLSALVSAEPRISLLKLISVSSFLIYYLVRALVETRRAAAATAVAALMIASGAAGALWSVFEVARGRGVVIEEVAPDSPLRHDPPPGVAAGDSIWRVNKRRVNSVAEIDQAIRDAPAGEPLALSLFSRGEQVERVGQERVTGEWQRRASPSGLGGTRRAHRFRASGWTRHYQTFAETLQILAQLSLGFTFAYWQRRRAPLLPPPLQRATSRVSASRCTPRPFCCSPSASRSRRCGRCSSPSPSARRWSRGARRAGGRGRSSRRSSSARSRSARSPCGARAPRARCVCATRVRACASPSRASPSRASPCTPSSATAWTPSKHTGRSGAFPAT